MMTSSRINFKIKAIIIALIIGLSFAGCAVKAEETEKDKIKSDLLVKWEKEGGFFGVQSSLNIYLDGRVILTEPRKEGELTLSEIKDLKDVFQNSNFFSLEDKYMYPSVVKDAITQRIIYVDDGKMKTVITDYIPLELKNIILKLEEIERNVYKIQ